MLRNKIQENIRAYLKKHKVRESIDLGQDFKVEFLAQGEYNINFVIYDNINKYVFRVNTQSQLGLDNQIKYEYDALRKLEISMVTPKVYYVDDSKTYFDYGILIMEFLEGNPLEYNKDISKAGEIFGKIHGLDLKKIDTSNFIIETNILQDRIREGNKLLKNVWDSKLIDKNVKEYFYKLLNYCENNINQEKYFIDNKYHVINNTEVNSHNFIIGKKAYLIDWEKPVISDPCQDITQFLAPTTTLWKQNYLLNKEEKELFYKTYKSNLKDDINIEERVNIYNPYLYLRALGWCAGAYLEYQDSNKAIVNTDTLKKIEEYLDINFLENVLKEYI